MACLKIPRSEPLRMDTAPETRPHSATLSSTLSYTHCDADHSNAGRYFGSRYFCHPCDLDRNSCRRCRSSRGTPRSAQPERHGATSGALGAGVPSVTPAGSHRSRARCPTGVRGASPARPRADPARPGRRRSPGRIDRDDTVTAAIPPPLARFRRGRWWPPGGRYHRVTTASCALPTPLYSLLYSVRRVLSACRYTSGCAGKPVGMWRNTCSHCPLRTASFLSPRNTSLTCAHRCRAAVAGAPRTNLARGRPAS